MGTIILPPTTDKKPIAGSNYGTSGFGVFQGGGSGIRIISIVQTIAGSCDLNLANPCVATSTHVVTTSTPEGAVTYTWSITLGAATIVSGQGTDTIEVESTGDTDNYPFQMTCVVTDAGGDEPSEATAVAAGNHTRIEETIFDGGLFVNGGFERGLDNWENYNAWTVNAPEDNVENPTTAINQLLYQNMTLVEGAAFGISAEHLEGDAVINFMINDVDSGVDIRDGVHVFMGIAAAVSIGIYIPNVGTVKSVIDNMRLVRLMTPETDFSATPDPLVIQYLPV